MFWLRGKISFIYDIIIMKNDDSDAESFSMGRIMEQATALKTMIYPCQS